MDDGGVDGGLAALVGEDEGDAEDVADEPWDAVGGSDEQFSGLRGDQVFPHWEAGCSPEMGSCVSKCTHHQPCLRSCAKARSALGRILARLRRLDTPPERVALRSALVDAIEEQRPGAVVEVPPRRLGDDLLLLSNPPRTIWSPERPRARSGARSFNEEADEEAHRIVTATISGEVADDVHDRETLGRRLRAGARRVCGPALTGRAAGRMIE